MNVRQPRGAVCFQCGEPVLWAHNTGRGPWCQACAVCHFFENHLTLAGDFSGQRFILMPWQRETVRSIFGSLDDQGRRLIKDVYLEVPKKNSKTTFCAGLVVYSLATAVTTGTEVYSAATSRDQAAHVFRAAAQMVKASPRLRERLDVIPSAKKIVRRDDPSSFYWAISADGDIHDGINPAFVVRDELHRWRTRKSLELNEVLERGTITRAEPLVVDITTAGEVDESPLCWRRHEYARQIAEGTIEDRRFYGRIWAADLTQHDWTSKAARVQANPSHEDNGGYLKDGVLEDLCQKAINDPQAKADYLRYHLNVWGQRENRAIDMDAWHASGGDVDLREWPTYDTDLLIRKWGLMDRPCWAGVDASWTTDLTAVSFIFPEADGGYRTALFFFMPEKAVRERERKDRVPYGEWVRKGFIQATPGNQVDLSAVVERLNWGREMFDLRHVCFDPWNFRQTASTLSDGGFEVMEVRQGYQSLTAATKKLLALYLDRQLIHGNNPVFNWNASCLCTQSDNKDNIQPAKPDRSRETKRIDGISATVTALAVAMHQEAEVSVGVTAL